MYKLETSFGYFRINNTKKFLDATFNVTWYVLDNNDGEDEGNTRGFTYPELQQFQNYVIGAVTNFPPNGKNYSPCNEDEITPDCGMLLNFQSDPSLDIPRNIILRKVPTITKGIDIYSCMDVMLVNQSGDDSHAYNLEFNVVGRIEQLS